MEKKALADTHYPHPHMAQKGRLCHFLMGLKLHPGHICSHVHSTHSLRSSLIGDSATPYNRYLLSLTQGYQWWSVGLTGWSPGFQLSIRYTHAHQQQQQTTTKKKQSNHREAFKTLSTIYSSNNSLVFDKTVFLPLEAFTSISLPLLSGGYAPTFLSYLLVSKSSCTCYITPISQIMLHFS